jgi:hypothetical protein
MSVTIVSSAAVPSVDGIDGARQMSATTSVNNAPESGVRRKDVADDDTATVSSHGALLSKLKDLETSDPTKFKAVMTQISVKLKEDGAPGNPGDKAGAAGGSDEHTTLAALAAKLGGSPPPQAAPPAKAAKSTDPADTNRDGKISDKERLAYKAKKAAAHGGASGAAHAYTKVAGLGDSAKAATAAKVASVLDAAH